MEGLHNNSSVEACPVCLGSRLTLLKGYERAHLTMCVQCDFVFSKRIPTPAELQSHYSLYRRNDPLSPVTSSRYETILDYLEQFRVSNNLLDVGCGDGHFLRHAMGRGWHAVGIEITDEAVATCTRSGLQVIKGPLDVHGLVPGSFDVISMMEVLEHFPDPRPQIELFSTFIRMGGVAYVTTPNFDSLSRYLLRSTWNVIDYPEHLSYFTVSTLRRLFENSGFRKWRCTTSGFSFARMRRSLGGSGSNPSDETLRQRIEGHRGLRAVKWTMNELLNVTRSGDTLKATFQKS